MPVVSHPKRAVTFAVEFDTLGRADAVVSCIPNPNHGDPQAGDSISDSFVEPMLLLGNYFGCKAVSQPVPLARVYMMLGRLDYVLWLLDRHNAMATGEQVESDPFVCAYIRASAFLQLSDLNLPCGRVVDLSDLRELVDVTRQAYGGNIEQAQCEAQGGVVSFGSLAEIYTPGTKCIAEIGSSGLQVGVTVRSSWFEEHTSVLSTTRTFKIEVEFLACVGHHFAFVVCVLSLESFDTARPVSQLPIFPLDLQVGLRMRLWERGGKSIECAKGRHLRTHTPGTFWANDAHPAQASCTSQCLIDLDVIVGEDVAQGLGLDPLSEAVRRAVGQYSELAKCGHFDRKQPGVVHYDAATKMVLIDDLVLFEDVPETFAWCCWPTLPVFSVDYRCFGQAVAWSLQPLRKKTDTWEAVALPPNDKTLLRASLVQHHGEGAPASTITSRGRGLTILLQGPPGTGKSFTVGAAGDLLQCPVYVINARELGPSHDSTERRMLEALQACAQWNLILVIDDVDVLFGLDACESRSAGKPLAHTMLHVLERHRTIVFLTAHKHITDPVLQSHLTLTLSYPELSADRRSALWQAALREVRGTATVAHIDVDALAAEPLNGWQIRNTLRLAVAWSQDSGRPLDQHCLERALKTNTQIRTLRDVAPDGEMTREPTRAPSAAHSDMPSTPASNESPRRIWSGSAKSFLGSELCGPKGQSFSHEVEEAHATQDNAAGDVVDTLEVESRKEETHAAMKGTLVLEHVEMSPPTTARSGTVITRVTTGTNSLGSSVDATLQTWEPSHTPQHKESAQERLPLRGARSLESSPLRHTESSRSSIAPSPGQAVSSSGSVLVPGTSWTCVSASSPHLITTPSGTSFSLSVPPALRNRRACMPSSTTLPIATPMSGQTLPRWGSPTQLRSATPTLRGWSLQAPCQQPSHTPRGHPLQPASALPFAMVPQQLPQALLAAHTQPQSQSRQMQTTPVPQRSQAQPQTQNSSPPQPQAQAQPEPEMSEATQATPEVPRVAAMERATPKRPARPSSTSLSAQ